MRWTPSRVSVALLGSALEVVLIQSANAGATGQNGRHPPSANLRVEASNA